MQCSSCQASHGLYVSHYNRSGMQVEQRRWVRREVLEQIASAEQRARNSEIKLDSYLETTYSEPWLAWFAGKSKKAIWQHLVADGRDYPSLAMFYAHARQDGIEKTLRRYLRHDEVETLLRILVLKDSKIEQAVAELSRLGTEVQEAHALASQRADA